MSEKFELSRRKALAGLATIGAAGAGAGLGTSALFSDTESFEENTFTAGTLDMQVEGEIVATNEGYQNAVGDVTGNPLDSEEVRVGFDLDDVKPGDWFILCLTVDAKDDSNPFYVTLHADDLQEKEGASTEPERDVDDDTDNSNTEGDNWSSVTETNAELGDKLLTSYWEDYDGSGEKSGLSTLDNITNTESNQIYDGTYLEPDEDGVASSDPAVGYTDLREFFYGLDQDPENAAGDNDPLGNGFGSGDGILVGGTSDPVEVGRTDNIDRDRLSDPDEDGESELVFYLLFELPTEVGNEIQGDAVRGDLRISAEQVRNNEDPRSGRTESTTTQQS